jgi:hypothetical protein
MGAAGLWNPIVFRRINKSWMADEFIPELESFYPRIEKLVGTEFYRPRPVWRIHGSKQELDKWFEKKELPGFNDYLHNPPDRLEETFGISPEFGEGEVAHTGYLDIPEFLESAREYFEHNGNYQEADLIDCPSLVSLQEYRPGEKGFSRIIDCRGSRAASSDWWSFLPFGLTKGEVLTLRCPNLDLHRTFNAGFFVLPLGEDLFRLGATFNWKDKSLLPTEEGKQELLNKFEKYFNVDYEVVEHKAGIRPTVQDRRPLLGKHPIEDHLFMFNGLGTKGVMLAPYLANHFLDWMFEGTELLPEANLARFAKYVGQENPSINYPHP